MSRRTLLSPAFFALAAGCFFLAAQAQDSLHGKWITVGNADTAAFVYATPPAGFDPLNASDAELENWGFPP